MTRRSNLPSAPPRRWRSSRREQHWRSPISQRSAAIPRSARSTRPGLSRAGGSLSSVCPALPGSRSDSQALRPADGPPSPPTVTYAIGVQRDLHQGICPIPTWAGAGARSPPAALARINEGAGRRLTPLLLAGRRARSLRHSAWRQHDRRCPRNGRGGQLTGPFSSQTGHRIRRAARPTGSTFLCRQHGQRVDHHLRARRQRSDRATPGQAKAWAVSSAGMIAFYFLSRWNRLQASRAFLGR